MTYVLIVHQNRGFSFVKIQFFSSQLTVASITAINMPLNRNEKSKQQQKKVKKKKTKRRQIENRNMKRNCLCGATERLNVK